MALPPSKRPPPKAPELGAFPLDHLRECRPEIQRYFKCLEAAEFLAPKCRDEVREYLHCRMGKGLMITQDISKFGLPSTDFVETRHVQKAIALEQRKTGIAAVPVVGENRFYSAFDDGYEAPKGEAPKAGVSKTT